MRRHVPNALTVAGGLCGVAGVVCWPAWWALLLFGLSLAFDAADGFAARRLGVSSPSGAELDWRTDVALSFAIAWRVFPPLVAGVATVLLFGLQWIGRDFKRLHRTSGRTLISACAALWAALF